MTKINNTFYTLLQVASASWDSLNIPDVFSIPSDFATYTDDRSSLSAAGAFIYNNILGFTDASSDRLKSALACLALLEIKTNDFYDTILKDTNRTYRLCEINLTSYNLRPLIAAMKTALTNNQQTALEYVSNMGLAEEYLSATSIDEQLGYLICSVVKELNSL